MLTLQDRGCHNINLVTPTHMVPHIVRALRMAVARGLRLPLVYNTGGYDELETIKKLDGIVDIYMPDFKFQDGEMTHKYCTEASNYPEVAAAAIKEMHRQVGVLKMDGRRSFRRIHTSTSWVSTALATRPLIIRRSPVGSPARNGGRRSGGQGILVSRIWMYSPGTFGGSLIRLGQVGPTLR
jgi:uncharacterized Fe-S radical SAM superfamily protein PflX